MSINIKRIERRVYWRDGYPHVKVGGKMRRVSALLQPGDANTKLRKNNGRGYLTTGLSLAPADSSGLGNTCPSASPGCRSACLDHQGMAAFWESIRAARIAKTVVFYREREWFLDQLRQELRLWQRKADRQGLRLAVRLNIFSDIPWESLGIIDGFPDVQFYDYTKNPRRAGQLRPNYWVTFSRSESNDAHVDAVLQAGNNVTIVFADNVPETWRGYQVVNGDETDLRFTDPRGVIVGLRLKAHSNAERENAIATGFAI